MVIDSYKVKSFWTWFNSISDELYQKPNDVLLLEKLDKEIGCLGPFDWEIGPWHKNEIYLTISPNLDADLLPITKEIVKSAISCKGWSFLYAKPEKGYKEEWDMLNEFNQCIHVNVKNWKYILYQFDDNSFDVDIADDLIQESSATRKLAAEISITNILGEEQFIKWIKNVKLINSDEVSDIGKWTPLKDLKRHLEKITTS